MLSFKTSSNTPPPAPQGRRQSGGGEPISRVLKREYAKYRAKFQEGVTTWLRLLPPLEGSRCATWVFPYQSYKLGSLPEFVAPNSVDPSLPNLVKQFDRFVFQTHRELHHAKSEGREVGLSMWPRARAIAWAIQTQPEAETKLVLVAGSFNDGQRGVEGLLHKLYRKGNEVIEDPTGDDLPPVDISSPDGGHLVGVPTTKGSGGMKAYGDIKTSAKPYPLTDENTSDLPDIPPLEDCLEIPSPEEQLDYLRKYIAEKCNQEPKRADDFREALEGFEATLNKGQHDE